MYRWNPRLLALPAAQDSKRRFRMRPDGFGLVQFLDDILGYDRDQFDALEKKFCSIFPEIASLKLVGQMAFRSPSDDVEEVTRLDQAEGKGLYFELRAGKRLVPATQASDGALLVLAYLTVLSSPERPSLLLVEEPENGIHPKRLRDVLRILRDLVAQQSRTQVVFTTHSPYAVDLLEPNEVTLCTKRVDGSVEVKRMADSETVREQHSLFTLGEIWTAEGDETLARDSAVPSP
jgi:predicted ATPase